MMDDADMNVECPYNKSHVLLKSRIQTHLVKCKKASLNPQQNVEPIVMKTCLFNANHHIKPSEWEHHHSVCPDMGVLTRYTTTIGAEKTVPYNPIDLPEPDEDWDAEPAAATYDPSSRASEALVLRSLKGGSKSERKAFRQQERDRINRLRDDVDESGAAGPSTQVKCEPVVVVEKHAFTDQALRHPKSTTLKSSVLGQGRGMTASSSQTVSSDGPLRMPGTGRGSTRSNMPGTSSMLSNVTEHRGGNNIWSPTGSMVSHVTNGGGASTAGASKAEEDSLFSLGALKLEADSDGFIEMKSKKRRKVPPLTDSNTATKNLAAVNGQISNDSFPHPSKGRGRLPPNKK